MKNKLIVITLLILFITYPLYAANTSYTITLNGMSFTPKNSVFILKDVLYIAADDFTALTYGQLTAENKTQSLSIQEHLIKFTPNDRISSIDGKIQILADVPLLVKGKTYIPVSILDYIKYPYTLDKANFKLTITSVTPYCRTSDDYKTHLLINSQIADLSLSLNDLITPAKASVLLDDAKKRGSYISFIDNTDKQTLLNQMYVHLKNSKEMQVKLREIDLLSAEPKVSALTTLPLKVTEKENTLTAQIGTETLPNNCIWAAYMPDDSPLKIDTNKSLDATLMRILYEYYRDKHDLKDDLYFSPAVLINTGRSDYTSYTVYSEHLASNPKNVFNVLIYKTSDDKNITYVVDFVRHE